MLSVFVHEIFVCFLSPSVLEECELSSWLLSWGRHGEGLSFVLKMTPFHPNEGSS